jgi:SAM-dependent methyltransferase
MEDGIRNNIQDLVQKAYARNDPTGWFEELYREAKGDEAVIPWADLTVNPNLASWIEKRQLSGEGKTALVVGCGLGDDAEALAELGFKVVGFDISPTAIAWCQQRFPNSPVNYLVDDLLQPTKIIDHQFDFILESYTLQALPALLRPQAMSKISQLLALDGRLLVICRGRDITEPATQLPFPLTKEELAYFEELGLQQVHLEDYLDQETKPVRRLRIEYKRAN